MRLSYHREKLVIRGNTDKLNWGVSRVRVLCAYGNKELWQVLGSTTKDDVFKGSFSPGRMLLVSNGHRYHTKRVGKVVEIQDTARLDKKFITEKHDLINKFFNADVADKLDNKTTLVVRVDNNAPVKPIIVKSNITWSVWNGKSRIPRMCLVKTTDGTSHMLVRMIYHDRALLKKVGQNNYKLDPNDVGRLVDVKDVVFIGQQIGTCMKCFKKRHLYKKECDFCRD